WGSEAGPFVRLQPALFGRPFFGWRLRLALSAGRFDRPLPRVGWPGRIARKTGLQAVVASMIWAAFRSRTSFSRCGERRPISGKRSGSWRRRRDELLVRLGVASYLGCTTLPLRGWSPRGLDRRRERHARLRSVNKRRT